MTEAKNEILDYEKSKVPDLNSSYDFILGKREIVDIFTDDDKVNEIRKNQKLTLYYSGNKGTGYVSIIGTARIVDDQSKKDSLWKEGWAHFYKNRNKDYLLIKIVPNRLELLNLKNGIAGDKKTWRTPSVTF